VTLPGDLERSCLSNLERSEIHVTERTLGAALGNSAFRRKTRYAINWLPGILEGYMDLFAAREISEVG
jgi:hypothetical protein